MFKLSKNSIHLLRFGFWYDWCVVPNSPHPLIWLRNILCWERDVLQLQYCVTLSHQIDKRTDDSADKKRFPTLPDSLYCWCHELSERGVITLPHMTVSDQSCTQGKTGSISSDKVVQLGSSGSYIAVHDSWSHNWTHGIVTCYGNKLCYQRIINIFHISGQMHLRLHGITCTLDTNVFVLAISCCIQHNFDMLGLLQWKSPWMFFIPTHISLENLNQIKQELCQLYSFLSKVFC